MIRAIAILLGCLALSACFKDETVAGYGAAGKTWVLVELDGTPFGARATLEFPKRGQVAGQAPCNRYTAKMDTPYPWFGTENMIVSRATCQDQDAENAFFAALNAMTLSEVSSTVLILSNDAGGEMVFKADG